jgi:hypothetical protein
MSRTAADDIRAKCGIDHVVARELGAIQKTIDRFRPEVVTPQR